jgi:hypothetical protein
LHRAEDWQNGSGSFCAYEAVSDYVTLSDSLRTNACGEGLSIWSEAVVISFQMHLLVLFLRLGWSHVLGGCKFCRHDRDPFHHHTEVESVIGNVIMTENENEEIANENMNDVFWEKVFFWISNYSCSSNYEMSLTCWYHAYFYPSGSRILNVHLGVIEFSFGHDCSDLLPVSSPRCLLESWTFA